MLKLAAIAALVCGASAAVNTAGRPAKPKKYNTSAKRVEGKLNVHIVPHTHDDVGWLKTVDQYYYGNRNDIQRAEVQNIIGSVIKELEWNPDRKFIYVEQAFFQRFWEEADEKTQTLIQKLVANGQLEFINGGWCMHDEAAPGFVDMIDQTTLGHRLLKEQFGVMPKTTWQIDPFGHSAFQGYAMSSPLSGFNGVFVARIDYQDFNQRGKNLTRETVWAPSPSLGTDAATLFGVMNFGYGPPPGFDMAEWSSDAPVMDDPTLEDFNVDEKVAAFIQAATSAPYRGNDVLFTMGSDFNFENANTWFVNLDKIIHYVNQNGTVNAFYSTPSQYAAAKAATTPLPLKTDDFFPYADGPHAYWSGYFVSRQGLKGYIRDTSSYFQAAKQLQAFTGGAPDMSPANPLYRLERALGVNQHHDAVSGTSKQHVAYDYARRLAWGRQDADGLVATALAQLSGFHTAPFVTCELANATICPAAEGGAGLVLAIYNQQAQPKYAHSVLVPVGLPAGVASYAVYNGSAAAVTAQLIPLSARDQSLRSTYYNYSSATPVQWLAFQVDLPASGYAVYFLQPSATAEGAPSTHASVVRTLRVKKAHNAVLRPKGSSSSSAAALVGDQTFTNGVVTLTVSGTTGLVTNYANSQTQINAALSSTFLWYNSSVGNAEDGQPSGAYIFRPNTSTQFPIAGAAVTVDFVTGPVVNEARQTFADWMTQVVRLWAGKGHAEFEYTIGPIPWQDGLGKEVIAKYSTAIKSNSSWWSDSNGRDSIARVRNSRFSWNYTVEEPVAGNYVPVNAFTFIRDIVSGTTMSVSTDRTQGVASMADGELEIMIQRRLQADDYRGVGEPLNETGLNINGTGLIVRGTHIVSVDPQATAAQERRRAVANQMWRQVNTFAPLGSLTPAQWLAAGYKPSYTALINPLPENVHLLTVHSLGPNRLLLRLSHSFETNEDAALSQPATVALASIFVPSAVTLTNCTETTLTANQALADVPKTTYTLDDGRTLTLPVVYPAPAGPTMSVTLNPMEIRTFMCTTA